MKRTKFPTDEKQDRKGRVLEIDLNEEYKVKVEKPYELTESYFEKIYKKAGKAVSDILVKSEEAKKLDRNSPFSKHEQEYNNIISFCGERGTGKSSAMISFASSLLNFSETGEFYKDFSILRNYKYYPISTIDPSMFEEKENIFEVVLAQLFSSFEKELNKTEKKNDLEAKREVLDLFQKVFENLKTVQKNGEKYDGEALETLSKLSCGANLRQNFSKLVLKFLEFVKPEKEDKACLIIPIDDFDLNVNAVADMAEQIRKYLMIPRVVILMAANIDQLSETLEIDYDAKLNRNKDIVDNDKVKEKVQDYLTKLIPNERRLHLYNLTIENNIKLRIIWRNGEEPAVDGFDVKPINPNSSQCGSFIEGNLEKMILKLLFLKSGILLVSPEHQSHKIIPKDIRTLKELISLLIYKSKFENSDYDRLQQFVIEKYLSPKVNGEETRVIQEWKSRPALEKNQFLINDLYKSLEDNCDQLSVDELVSSTSLKTEFENLLDKSNYNHNISLGDLLLFLKYYEKRSPFKNFDWFLFAIKFLYSLELQKKLRVENDSSLEYLIGGSPINVVSENLLPRFGRNKISRDHYSIALNGFPEQLNEFTLLEWLSYFCWFVGKNNKVAHYRRSKSPISTSSLNFESGNKFNHFEFNISLLISTIGRSATLNKVGIDYEPKSDSLAVRMNSYNEKTHYIVPKVFCNIEIIEKIISWDFDQFKEKGSIAYGYQFKLFVRNLIKIFKQFTRGFIDDTINIEKLPLFKILELEYLIEELSSSGELSNEQKELIKFCNSCIEFVDKKIDNIEEANKRGTSYLDLYTQVDELNIDEKYKNRLNEYLHINYFLDTSYDYDKGIPQIDQLQKAIDDIKKREKINTLEKSLNDNEQILKDSNIWNDIIDSFEKGKDNPIKTRNEIVGMIKDFLNNE